MLYLGIDQHARQLTVNNRDEQGDVVLKRQVSTDPVKVDRFFEELGAAAEAAGGYVAILEVCGFNDWLLAKLAKAPSCRQVILTQPEQRQRQKTDRRDAAKLSELLWTNRHRLLKGEKVRGLRQVQIPSDQDRDDRRLTQRRRDLSAELTRLLNRVRHLVRRHNRQHECPTKSIQAKAARHWLKALDLPAIDRLEMDQLTALWELLEKQLKDVDVLIAQRASKNKYVPIVQSLPGAANYTALAIACRIGDIGAFPRSRSLANFFGLTPGCRNSGESGQRIGAITKAGSAFVRFLLGQITLHALRFDPGLKRWYGKVRGRRGSKIARVAVMRRLTVSLWRMLRDNTNYAPVDDRLRRPRRTKSALPTAAPVVAASGG